MRLFAALSLSLLFSLTAQATPKSETIVLAGGCFWGVEGVYEHVKGVTKVVSGYAGGAASTASYDAVSDGETGHAEAVEVTYDPSQVSLKQLLKVFFNVAHDPTQLNRQGPDHGTQYRSAIFYSNRKQQEEAHTYIAELDAAKIFGNPIVTKLEPLTKFYPAEDYHQDYMKKHPNNPYVMINDRPKISHLRTRMPELYVETSK